MANYSLKYFTFCTVCDVVTTPLDLHRQLCEARFQLSPDFDATLRLTI